MTRVTPFYKDRFNQMIRAYNETGRMPELPQVNSIEDLQAQYPPCSKEDLRKISERFIEKGYFKGGYIISTSGTTSTPLVLCHRIWGDASEGTYAYQLMSYLMRNVFTSEDTVANLYTPGGLGVLYEGSNRFLEAICATILPVGQLQSIGSDPFYFQIFEKFGLNTVMGAPSSVVQFAKQALEHGVELDIRKIVYTGEHFYPTKQELIAKVWPDATYFSMFGAVEYGFAGVHTPTMPAGVHELLDDWYFFETDEDDNVLVTVLTSPEVPVIRYKIGDKGKLLAPYQEGAGHGLILGDRSDTSFNIAGNAVGFDRIKRTVEQALGLIDRIQIILDTDDQGRDVLTLALDADCSQDSANTGKAHQALDAINEIAEGIERGTVLTRVVGREGLVMNWRTKANPVIDHRREAQFDHA
ncbi:hypothetical protein [Pseudovibrio sp. WM33]|uniref:hypothetical protein n=1 Tax=Pseudovibrio sp. WM33 TaxID=1735585 RepID=UPI0007AE5196|nr:hypothetical protein [Pseudovibrio sp. WM33]KZL24687.1 hypothetical protein PsWM33_02361 [Pseudovibrio sp. WM33]